MATCEPIRPKNIAVTGDVHYIKFNSGYKVFWTIPNFVKYCRQSRATSCQQKVPKTKNIWIFSLRISNYNRERLELKLKFSAQKSKCSETVSGSYEVCILNEFRKPLLRQDAFVTDINNLDLSLTNDVTSATDILLNGALTVFVSLTTGETNNGNLLRGIFESGVMSDVQCVTGDASFKCHKYVLAFVSPVLQRMIEEKLDNVVDFHGVLDEVALKDMLTFIYTEQTPNIQTTHKDLLIGACSYELEDLKAWCQLYIAKEMLTVDNAVEYLQLALDNNVIWLKEYLLYFAVLHLGVIKETEGYKNAPEYVKEVIF